jgi:N-acetylglucosaminyldiphosphoundecaprenol N-acetyl-beta-D-mannosaminyltransferase
MGQLAIDCVTFAEAVEEIERLVAAGQGGSVFTPNVDHVVLAESDPRFREAYGRVSLSLVDGMPLLWASRLLGAPLPERVSGSDLVLPLMKRAAQRGWRVYLTGAAPGVSRAAAEFLRGAYGVKVVGADSPMIRADGGPSEDSEATLARIREARAELVLVGFGAPKQELWIHRHAQALAPAVAVAIGAGIDFMAGRIPRAPRWMSRSGLEWLYRLAREPRRLWRRYLLRDPAFLLIVYRSWMRTREERIESC